MWRAFYQVVLSLALPVVAIRLWWRGHRAPTYRARWRERFGDVSGALPAGVWWFHTVSAGEAIAAAPLIRAFVEHGFGPVLVTTMTPTGAQAVTRLLGSSVAHCYAPYDFGWAVRQFLDRVRPRALVLLETELWPNLIELTARRDVPVMLVNARLSEQSARGYRLIGGLTRQMLARLEWIACQYESQRARFVALGAAESNVITAGSVKFDVRVDEESRDVTRQLAARFAIGDRPVWIAASTHTGEDEVVLRAHRAVLAEFPAALLILVPRHPERFAAVHALAERSTLRTACVSGTPTAGADPEVLVGDTMGQLMALYGLARVAFVGGSLVRHGGHNPIEPAVLGVPIVAGPHTFNFADVAACFESAGCLHRVTNDDTLAREVSSLLRDAGRAQHEGAIARQVVDQNRGATDRLLKRLIVEAQRSGT